MAILLRNRLPLTEAITKKSKQHVVGFLVLFWRLMESSQSMSSKCWRTRLSGWPIRLSMCWLKQVLERGQSSKLRRPSPTWMNRVCSIVVISWMRSVWTTRRAVVTYEPSVWNQMHRSASHYHNQDASRSLSDQKAIPGQSGRSGVSGQKFVCLRPESCTDQSYASTLYEFRLIWLGQR